MPTNRSMLDDVIEKGEEKNGSIEFKSQLSESIHLADDKRSSLAAQLKYRVKSGDGEATYVIGVNDDGDIKGLKQEDFSETIDILSLLCSEVDVHIDNVETWNVNEDHLVGLVDIKEGSVTDGRDDHIIIGTAGHVDHGKSTLVGCLMTGQSDNGKGHARSYLDVKPHEIERGLSADLSYAVYGFKDEEPLRMNNPNRSSDRSELVHNSEKLVSFVDTVGHKPWLRTTIRGLVGQKIDYGLLTIAADDGPTQTTKEHLGLLIATDLPVITVITKTDMVSDERVDEVELEVEKILRQVDRNPLSVKRYGVETAIDEVRDGSVPILRTSAINMDGIGELDQMLYELPPNRENLGSPKMYIDKTYNIEGIGTVVSGTVQSGAIKKGDELMVGPFDNGEFRETTARSIEIHYYDVDKASPGQIASVAISNVDINEIKRGMVLIPANSQPKSTTKFEAEVMVLNHPTKITTGYEPVVHLETISETGVIETVNGQMVAGDKDKLIFRFKFNEHYIEEGQKFVFREGDSKGVGKVTNILE